MYKKHRPNRYRRQKKAKRFVQCYEMATMNKLRTILALIGLTIIISIVQVINFTAKQNFTNEDNYNVVLDTEEAVTPTPTTRAALNKYYNDAENKVIGSQKNIRETSGPSVKIVAFADFDYRDVAKWWYNRMTDLGYTTHNLILIDSEAVNHFHELNKGKNPGEQGFYRTEIEIVDPGKRRKNKVRSLWYHRIRYCLNQLNSGQSLLLTDVDNIFTKYEPLSNFQSSEYDAIYALEGRFPEDIFRKQGFVLCGGMTFLKSTKSTISVVEKLLGRCRGAEGALRCDDQREWNQMLLEDMNWNTVESLKNLNNAGLIQFGFDGVSNAIDGFRAKVWDRDFAWRGPFGTMECPSEENWVAMPSDMPYRMKRFLEHLDNHEGITSKHGAEKIARVTLWELYCGKNGVNRGERKAIDEESMNARIDEALESYRALQ